MPRTRCAPSPREAKRSGERVGVRGIFSARPPHPILDVATTEVPSRRKRGEGAITMTARVTTSHHFPHSRFRSCGAFSAPGFCNFGFATPIEGWRSAESRTGACEAPVGPARNAAGQAPNEAPCVPYGGRPPPGAPPWRFWAPVPRFPHRQLP